MQWKLVGGTFLPVLRLRERAGDEQRLVCPFMAEVSLGAFSLQAGLYKIDAAKWDQKELIQALETSGRGLERGYRLHTSKGPSERWPAEPLLPKASGDSWWREVSLLPDSRKVH